jgi:hypothetical protein
MGLLPMNTCLALALSAISAVAAQNAPDQPIFEVASVKRTNQRIINNSLGPGTITLRGDPVKIVLMEAFKVKSYQIVGPSWLDEDCFEIIAKMPEGSTSDQIPAMLQALLVERFKLAVHKDDRPRPMYALVVGKSGPKCNEADLSSKDAHAGQIMFRAGSGTVGFNGPIGVACPTSFEQTAPAGTRLYWSERNIRHRPLLGAGSSLGTAEAVRQSFPRGTPKCRPSPLSYSRPLYCHPGLAGIEAGARQGAC